MKEDRRDRKKENKIRTEKKPEEQVKMYKKQEAKAEGARDDEGKKCRNYKRAKESRDRKE